MKIVSLTCDELFCTFMASLFVKPETVLCFVIGIGSGHSHHKTN